MAEGGFEFGHEDPDLTISLITMMMMMKNKRLKEPNLLNQVRHPLPTTGVNKWKCILCGTSSPACLTLLIRKKTLCLKEHLQSLIFKKKVICGKDSKKL